MKKEQKIFSVKTQHRNLVSFINDINCLYNFSSHNEIKVYLIVHLILNMRVQDKLKCKFAINLFK